MHKLTVKLADPEATERLGGLVGAALDGAGLVFLKGDLGAGKTTLVRGLLRSLGFQGSTKSPTYTLVEPYEFDRFKVYHFDLYRLADPEELEFIGVDEYLAEANTLCLVEWPDKGRGWLPEPNLAVELHYDKEQRQAVISSANQLIISKLQLGV